MQLSCGASKGRDSGQENRLAKTIFTQFSACRYFTQQLLSHNVPQWPAQKFLGTHIRNVFEGGNQATVSQDKLLAGGNIILCLIFRFTLYPRHIRIQKVSLRQIQSRTWQCYSKQRLLLFKVSESFVQSCFIFIKVRLFNLITCWCSYTWRFEAFLREAIDPRIPFCNLEQKTVVIRPSLPRKGTFLSPPNSPRFVSAYFNFFLVLRGLVSMYHCYLTLNIANCSSYQTIAAGSLTSSPSTFFFIKGSSCLLCLNSLGKLLALSLPNLSPLMDVECSFLMKDYRQVWCCKTACVRACVDACRCIIERATSYSTAGQAWRLEPL